MKNIEVIKEKNNFKNKKGITLIALVVTIVVLLILAGVTILTLTGENGILRRASNAAEATQKETATEKMNFKITNIQINTYAKEQRMPTLQEIADEFYEDEEIEYVITKEEVAAKEKIDVTGYSSIFTKLSEYPYEFEIDSSLRLASINGVKIADNSSNNSEEIATLKATIAEMQQEIADLKSNQEETNSELETTKSNVENLAVSAITRETLYEGTAGTKLASYTIKDISQYKYIIVYADVKTNTNNARGCETSRIINVSNLKYNNTTTLSENTSYVISEHATTANYCIIYWFKSPTSLYIHNIIENSWTSPCIYRIEGIK